MGISVFPTPKAIISQATAPTNTDSLWLDTEAPADILIGPTGPTGPTGAIGPSDIQNISIPSWTLNVSTASGYATSNQFGTLLAGKSYQINTQLWATGNATGVVLGFDLLASAGTAPSYFFTVADLKPYATNPGYQQRYGINSIATITVGASNITLAIKIIDAGADTNGNPLTLTGKSLITLVGSIS